MIPRIAGKRANFKAVGQYYLHDKGAQTKERVAWTHSHNIYTDDPEAALKWMAYTAINANRLKMEAGVPLTGRKSNPDTVYVYSLSWPPADNPTKEDMTRAALNSLERIGLKDHEALLVCHNDTDHPHVHVIANMVNPTDGRKKDPSWFDKLKFSDYALDFEQKQGRIDCPQRVINHAKRNDPSVSQYVAYQEKPHVEKEEIQTLWKTSDSGKAFMAALQEKDIALCKGDRRGFVLVDETGKTYSLSRQLKGTGVKAKELKQRLSDVAKDLPQATDVSFRRKHYDRDHYHAQWEDKLIDAAIAHDKEKIKEEQREKAAEERKQGERGAIGRQRLRHNHFADSRKEFVIGDPSNIHQEFNAETHDETKAPVPRKPKKEKKKQAAKLQNVPYDAPHLERLDARQQWDRMISQKMGEREDMLLEYYNRDDMVQEIKDLKKAVRKSDNFLGRLTGQHEKHTEALEALTKSLKSVDNNMRMQLSLYRSELEKDKPDILKDIPDHKKTTGDPEAVLRNHLTFKQTAELNPHLKNAFDAKKGRNPSMDQAEHDGPAPDM